FGNGNAQSLACGPPAGLPAPGDATGAHRETLFARSTTNPLIVPRAGRPNNDKGPARAARGLSVRSGGNASVGCFGCHFLAGLLIDDLHRQADLAALVEAHQLDLHGLALLDDVLGVGDALIGHLADVHQPVALAEEV